MIYQNYRGDFLIVEKFYRDSLRLEPVPVPEHVRVKYFTRGREGVFVAERDGVEYGFQIMITIISSFGDV